MRYYKIFLTKSRNWTYNDFFFFFIESPNTAFWLTNYGHDADDIENDIDPNVFEMNFYLMDDDSGSRNGRSKTSAPVLSESQPGPSSQSDLSTKRGYFNFYFHQ